MNQRSKPQTPESGETFDALRQRIRDRFPTLSPHLQRIARASLEETNAFALNTTPVIAGELGIQPSTLIRFAKEFGYAGFSDLQRVFRQRLIEGQVNVRNEVMARDEATAPLDTRAAFEACLKAHKEAIERLERECDHETLNRAIHTMRKAGHVYVAGLRRSRPIADYFHYGMIRGEKACSMLDFAGGMAGPQIATMKPDDVLFAIAFPPYSQPVVDIVLDAHVSGRRVIAMTDSADSPLATYAELALLLGADTAAQLQPISGALALVQNLVMAITRHA